MTTEQRADRVRMRLGLAAGFTYLLLSLAFITPVLVGPGAQAAEVEAEASIQAEPVERARLDPYARSGFTPRGVAGLTMCAGLAGLYVCARVGSHRGH